MMNRDFALALKESEEIELESVKRSPAVEYGHDRAESPYAGCVDCYQVFKRMLNACYGKEF